MEHNHSPEEERRIREAALDETLAGTFPASDAPSTLPNPDDHAAGGVLIPDEPTTSDRPASARNPDRR
jgi:hypothetical protein